MLDLDTFSKTYLMKKMLLIVLGVLGGLLNTYADSEKLWLIQDNGVFIENPTNAPQFHGCSEMAFRITFKIPDNYTQVKQFDWYVNGQYVKSETNYFVWNALPDRYSAVFGLQVRAANNDVVCKVIYKNGSSESTPVETAAFRIVAESLPFSSIGSPWTLPTGAGQATFTFQPAANPTYYNVNWTFPAGWTVASYGARGYTATVNMDAAGAGLITATATYDGANGCHFEKTATLTVARYLAAPVFTHTTPIQICGSTSGGINYVTLSINPVQYATGYFWRIIPEGTGAGITFTENGLKALGTTATSVQVAVNTTVQQAFRVAVQTYGQSPTTETWVSYLTEPQWNPYISFDPGCIQHCGSGGAVSFTAGTEYIAGATYTWYMDGLVTDIVSGSPTTYQYYTGSEVNLQVKATNGCGSTAIYSAPIPVSCDCFMARSANNNNGAATIYPNPATGSELTVALKTVAKNNLQDIKQIRITDKLGHVKKVMKLPAGTRQAKVSLAGLPPNVYFIEVTDGTIRTNLQFNRQ